MGPSENLKIGDNEIAQIHKYKYLAHEIQTARVNQTTELDRKFSWHGLYMVTQRRMN